MKTLTWSDFDQYNPCYSPAERYGEWSGTILDLLKREDISAKDRLWAATRPEILDDKMLRIFACKCVREVWHLLTDERSRKAVEVAERYAVGEATDNELEAAKDAAWDAKDAAMAARDDAMEAAMDAAWDAARAAERAAALYASDAASYAASYAAWSAASYAAWVKQVEILIHLIEEGGKQ